MRILKEGAAMLAQRWRQELDLAVPEELSPFERAKLITAQATAGRGVAALIKDVAQLEPEELVPPQAPPVPAPPPAAPDPLHAPAPPQPSEDDMMDDLPAPSELAALPDAAVRTLVAERLDELLEPCDTKSLDRDPEPRGPAPLRQRSLADEGAARSAPA